MLPLHCHDAVLSFAEAVVRQVAHPLGAPPVDAAEHRDRELRVAERFAAVLRLACGADGRSTGHDSAGHDAEVDAEVDRAAALLAGDAALLSACFQNTDLLPHAGAPAADAVALLVLRAMERLAATPTG